MTNEAEIWAIGKLMAYTRSAMVKAGIELNEEGTEDFADAVFFDMQMSDLDKIRMLEMVEDDSQHDRIEALREVLTEKGIVTRNWIKDYPDGE